MNLNVSKLVCLHDRPHDTSVTVRRDKISLSLRSWGGFLCPGYFLGGGGATPHTKRAAKPWGKIPPAAFLMSFECRPFLSARLELFDYPVRKSGVIDTDRTRKGSQAKRNNQVTDRNNYMLQVIQDPGRVLSSYSKFLETKTSIQRWFSHSKKLYASKEVKRSPLNCFRGQIMSENKKPQEIKPGMPRKHIS